MVKKSSKRFAKRGSGFHYGVLLYAQVAGGHHDALSAFLSPCICALLLKVKHFTSLLACSGKKKKKVISPVYSLSKRHHLAVPKVILDIVFFSDSNEQSCSVRDEGLIWLWLPACLH